VIAAPNKLTNSRRFIPTPYAQSRGSYRFKYSTLEGSDMEFVDVR
jgi:hypothetical protein